MDNYEQAVKLASLDIDDLLKYMYLYRRTNYLYQYIRSEAYMSYLDLILRLFQCLDSRPQGKHLCMFLRNQAKFPHYAYQQLRLWYCLYLYLCLFFELFPHAANRVHEHTRIKIFFMIIFFND